MMKIGIREAVERIKNGYFGSDGFDLQILVDCIGVLGNVIRNLPDQEIESFIEKYDSNKEQ